MASLPPCVSFVLATLFLFYLLTVSRKLGRPFGQHQTVGQQPMVIIDQEDSDQRQRRIILYWTAFFEYDDFKVGLGEKPFTLCSHLSCLTTNDRRLFNESDAVVFHGRDLRPNDLPPPGWRRRHQQFVFLLLESPMHTDLGLLGQPIFRHYFNRTMTYRRDSDIFYPYGRLECIRPAAPDCVPLPRVNDGVMHVPDGRSSAVAPSTSATGTAIDDVTSKNQTVVWFVSHCNTHSHRESLVRRLSPLIAVDVFGRCGAAADVDDRCSPSNRSECDALLGRPYRFYLSLENSLCADYVTEKLYRPLMDGTVPVVYGGADYSAYLPAGSYVDAMHFDSAQHLAQHLHRLMTDDRLYSTYFKWRGKYAVDASRSHGWCQLCRMLLADPSVQERTYSDIGAWWSGSTTNRTCTAAPRSLVD